MVAEATLVQASVAQEASTTAEISAAAGKVSSAAKKWLEDSKAWQKAVDETKKPDDARRAAAEASKKAYEQAVTELKSVKEKAGAKKDDGKEKSTFRSDHSGKHFTLLVGAVVLDPYEIEQTGTDPDDPQFRVGKGSTDVGFLIEAGFRRRWAWEAWYDQDLAQDRDDRESLRSQIAAEQQKTPPDAVQIGVWQTEINAIDRRIRERRISNRTSNEFAVYPGRFDRLTTMDGWKENCGRNFAAMFLVPDNYAVRLGFSPGSNSPSGAAAVAGGGNFYIETGVGFDWIRVLYPSGVEPMRVTAGPEVMATFSNDPDQDDFRQRVLAGAHLTTGIPISDNDERVAELVVRAGWVYVDVPDYINSTSRQIRSKNDVPAFNGEFGFGLDVEVNVPILKELGYIFLRATTNHAVDPNPWTTTIGYTIPIDQLVSMVRP